MCTSMFWVAGNLMIQWVKNKKNSSFLLVYLTPRYLGVYDVMRLCLIEVGEEDLVVFSASRKEETHERTGYQRRQLIS